MTSLREMLSRLKPGEELSNDTLARIETIIEAYNDPKIDSHFRSDILSAVGSVLDLAGTFSQRTYRVDELFEEIAKIQQYLSLMLRYGLIARPKISGYALFNSSNGAFIPGFYGTEEEANKQLAQYKALGINFPIIVLPAECVAGAITQPQQVVRSIPPPLSSSAMGADQTAPAAHPGSSAVPPTKVAEALKANETPKPGSPGSPQTPPFEAEKKAGT